MLTYVYVLSSPYMVDGAIYKIGRHTGSIKGLMARYVTPLIDPRIEYLYPCDNAGAIEKEIHHLLKDHRIRSSSGRYSEWFRCSLDTIMDAFLGVSSTISTIVRDMATHDIDAVAEAMRDIPLDTLHDMVCNDGLWKQDDMLQAILSSEIVSYSQYSDILATYREGQHIWETLDTDTLVDIISSTIAGISILSMEDGEDIRGYYGRCQIEGRVAIDMAMLDVSNDSSEKEIVSPTMDDPVPRDDRELSWVSLIGLYRQCRSSSEWVHKAKEYLCTDDYTREQVDSMHAYDLELMKMGKDITWRYAEDLYYSHWIRDNRDTIKMVSTMREECRSGLSTDGARRYMMLVRLRRYADITRKDRMVTMRFRCSLRDDEGFIALMKDMDKLLLAGIISKKGKCRRDLWKRLSWVLKHYYCIIHKAEYNIATWIDGEAIKCTRYTYNRDDLLI